jgi:hypothetical protein
MDGDEHKRPMEFRETPVQELLRPPRISHEVSGTEADTTQWEASLGVCGMMRSLKMSYEFKFFLVKGC